MLSVRMNGSWGMNIPKFLALVRARRWLVFGIAGSAVVLVLLASLAQPSRYRASADFLFGQTTAANAIVAGGTAASGDIPETRAATNLALASLDTLAARVRRRLRSPVTVEELKNAVEITPQGDSDIANVTAEWNTPATAAAVANAFFTEIVALRREAAQADIQRAIDALEAMLAQQPAPTPTPGGRPGTSLPAESDATRALRERISELQLLKALEPSGVRLVERATPPASRSSPKPLRNALIAGFVALVLALFVVVLLARFDERIHDDDELPALMEASVLARIPEGRRFRRQAQTRALVSDRAFIEAFEFLRLNLQFMGLDGGSRVIAVTSPTAGDGKTTVVSWLARSLALSGAEVVGVDLDLRKPELHTYLNATGDPGNGVLNAPLQAERQNHRGAPLSDDRPSNARRIYSDEDITAGLVELAQCGGNARLAARSLKAAGSDISEITLRRWKELHAPLYAEIRAGRMQPAGDTVTAEPYERETRPDDLAQATLHPHLRLVTGGEHPALPAGLTAPGRLQQLFAQLRRDSDYVLVDTVPVSTVADASAVAAAADGVIIVVDLERTRRKDLVAAKKQLGNARATVLGIVLNRAAVDYPAYRAHEEHRARRTAREPDI
jgi:Mrp family chromosome partitioning ATPase